MQIIHKTITPNTPIIVKLYTAIDAMDVEALTCLWSENITFKFGNLDLLTNRTDAIKENSKFFTTIQSVQHTITGIWEIGATIFCNGIAHYIRVDESKHEVSFATRLELKDGLITDYQVYVDLSEL